MTDRDKSFRDRIEELRAIQHADTTPTNWGTVFYSNSFEETGAITGRISIGHFEAADRPCVQILRDGDTHRTLLPLGDIERIDYHPPEEQEDA